MTGEVGILNVGAGDIKITFNGDDPQEKIRAARIVRDMLRRGYALLIDSGQRTPDGKPLYTRAKDFDDATCEYIIADLDSDATDKERPSEPATRGKRKRVAAESVSAVAVPRTAGG